MAQKGVGWPRLVWNDPDVRGMTQLGEEWPRCIPDGRGVAQKAGGTAPPYIVEGESGGVDSFLQQPVDPDLRPLPLPVCGGGQQLVQHALAVLVGEVRVAIPTSEEPDTQTTNQITVKQPRYRMRFLTQQLSSFASVLNSPLRLLIQDLKQSI